jgi:hypothetical protein
MILGMSISTFTLVHVVLSLVGIVAGLVVLFGMFGSKSLDGWTGLFLATTVLTSVTGYFFPSDHILPSHIVGAISLIAATVALYLNVFVAVVQAFQKLPFLASLAPTQSEPPFLIAQFVVLAIFIVMGVVAVRAFHPPANLPTLSAA